MTRNTKRSIGPQSEPSIVWELHLATSSYQMGLFPRMPTQFRLAKLSENAILRLMAACAVSSVDLDGIRHSVEVEAGGLYEASVLAICAFRKHELTPTGLTELAVEVHSSVTHTLPIRKVHEWLQRGVRTPKEAVLKERLRTLMSA